MSWFRRVFGRTSGVPGSVGTHLGTAPDGRPLLQPDDPRIGAGHVVLSRFWEGVGRPDPELLAPLENPELTGPLSWPGQREAYRIVRRAAGLILATDGLSDPFIGKCVTDESGFGVELFLDLPELDGAAAEEIRGGWAFELLTLIARNVAGFGGIADRLDREGTALMAVRLSDPPGAPWTDSGNYATVLIGLPARGLGVSLPLPFGAVRIVPVTLLQVGEAEIALRGEEQRRQIAGALMAAGHGHRTLPGRGSVL